MAKRNEYPSDRSIQARLGCIADALLQSGAVLINLRTLADKLKIPEGLRESAEAALAAHELAVRALNGVDE